MVSNQTLVEIGQLLNKDIMTLILYTWSYVKHIEYRFPMQSKTKTVSISYNQQTQKLLVK